MFKFKLKKKSILIPIIIIPAVLVAIGAVEISHRNDKKEEDRLELVKRAHFTVKIRETGNLEPLISVDVRSNVAGEVKKLYVREGDYVEKGQVLLEIDKKQVQEEKRQAGADVAAAEANLEKSKQSTTVTQNRLDSELKQATDALEAAKASLEAARASVRAAKATTLQMISQAETEIATTNDALEKDKNALQKADISLKQASSEEESAKISLKNSESENKRKEELYNKKFVSKKEVEDAELAHASAKSRYQAAQAGVAVRESDVEDRKKDIETRGTLLRSQQPNLEKLKEARAAQEEQAQAQEKQALAQLRSAQAKLSQLNDSIMAEKEMSKLSETSAKAALLRVESNLKNQEERLEWTSLLAPMSGIITKLEVEEGEIIISGRSAFTQGPAIMTVADLSKMVVKAKLHEVDIGKVQIGQKVEIKVDTFPDKAFEGRVSEISPSGQPKANENVIVFEVIIEVLGSPPELKPGMTANVDIIVDDRDEVLQLPLEAVIEKETMILKAELKNEALKKLGLDKKLEVENEVGKKFPAKVSKLSEAENKVELIFDQMPKGLRSGEATVKISISQKGNKGNKKDVISEVKAKIESEKKYYVILDKILDKKGQSDISDISDIESEKMPASKRFFFFPAKEKKELKGVETWVEVSKRNDTSIEILSGVKEGDKVYVLSLSELAKRDKEKEKEKEKKGNGQ